MPGVVDRLAASEGAPMFGDDPAVLADHDAIGIGMDLDRTPNRAGRHRVLVVVEADQASLGDSRWHGVEAVEPANIGNELRPFCLEHLPDRLFGQLGMAIRLRVSDAFIDLPGLPLLQGLGTPPRCEEARSTPPALGPD